MNWKGRLLFLLFGCGPLLAGCWKTSNPAAMIDAANVVSIKARMMHNPDDGPLIDEYEAAPEDIPRILALFKDGVQEPRDAVNWLRFGEIKITLRDGKTTTIEVWWTGAKRGAYRVNGVPVRGSSDKAFRDVIGECAKHGSRL